MLPTVRRAFCAFLGLAALLCAGSLASAHAQVVPGNAGDAAAGGAREKTSRPIIQVPFLLKDGKIYVLTAVNDHRALIVLDTGAATLIDHEFAVAVGARPIEKKLSGADAFGRPVTATMAENIVLHIGNTSIDLAGAAKLTDMTNATKFLAQPFQIILGSDLLKSFIVRLDFETSTLSVYASGLFDDFPASPAIPVHRAKSGLWAIDIATSVGGPESFMVDLGSGGSVLIALSETQRAAFFATHPSVETTVTSAAGTYQDARQASLDWLDLGGVRHRRIPVTVVPSGLEDRQSVGTALLSRYEVWLDFSSNRMWLKPNGKTAAAFPRSLTGITFDDDNMILDVVKGSPADHAGLKAGDRIVALFDASGAEIFDRDTIKPGDRVTFRLTEGSDKTITAAEFY